MKIKQVVALIEEFAPTHHAEDFDNVGLLVGEGETELQGILVTLDTLENVVDEAIAKKCNLIVSFHPIIFSGLKRLNGSNYVERTVIKAIRHHIAIYAIHTALDNHHLGVNHKICEVLGLTQPQILIPKKGTIHKLVTYVPTKDAELLKQALFTVGAGHLGNYSHCSFGVEGLGSFRANERANPTLGERGNTHFEKEEQINVLFESRLQSQVIKTLKDNHPYEEVAYEIIALENLNQNVGIGMIGTLAKPISEEMFLESVKRTMRAPIIRHSSILNKPVSKVAVLGGSGAFAISAAKAAGADVFLTADLKYHHFFEAENKILLADIGHFESEQFTKNLLVDFLTEKIANFAVNLSESRTNPVNYF